VVWVLYSVSILSFVFNIWTFSVICCCLFLL